MARKIVEFEIDTYDERVAKITGSEKLERSAAFVDLNRVTACYENESADGEPCTTILLNSGDRLTVIYPIYEFKDLWEKSLS